jgi:transposase
MSESNRYKDKDWLEQKYTVEGESTVEIAEQCGVNSGTVYYWLDKHGIKRRDRSAAATKRHQTRLPNIQITKDGYERLVTSYKNNTHGLYIHRLVAVAEYGLPLVCDNDVHHRNGIPWDNRPVNLEVVGHGEHRKEHDQSKRENTVLDHESARSIRDEYESTGRTMRELASSYGVSISTVSLVVNEEIWSE